MGTRILCKLGVFVGNYVFMDRFMMDIISLCVSLGIGFDVIVGVVVGVVLGLYDGGCGCLGGWRWGRLD